MKIQRFFVDLDIFGGFTPKSNRGETPTWKISISDKNLIHQWLNVFRLKAGNEVVLLDNSGYEYTARFLKLEKNGAEFEILGKRRNEVRPKGQVILCQSLIKKDKFEWAIQKGTEIGVAEFAPIISERSEKKALNIERLNIIAKEATEQSGRGKVPKIYEPKKLSEILKNFNGDGVALDSSGENFQFSVLRNTQDKFTNFQSISNVAIFIGPEGGWTENELKLFKEKNIKIVSLGNMTLRAETAAIAVSAVLLL